MCQNRCGGCSNTPAPVQNVEHLLALSEAMHDMAAVARLAGLGDYAYDMEQMSADLHRDAQPEDDIEASIDADISALVERLSAAGYEVEVVETPDSTVIKHYPAADAEFLRRAASLKLSDIAPHQDLDDELVALYAALPTNELKRHAEVVQRVLAKTRSKKP